MDDAGERDEVAARFGENLQHIRLEKQLKQEEVAFAARLHRTEVSLLERGERVPRIDTVARLAGALSVSSADLLEGIAWKARTSRGGRLEVTRRQDK